MGTMGPKRNRNGYPSYNVRGFGVRGFNAHSFDSHRLNGHRFAGHGFDGDDALGPVNDPGHDDTGDDDTGDDDTGGNNPRDEAEHGHPPFPALPAQSAAEQRAAESALDAGPRYDRWAYRAGGKLTGKVAVVTGADSGIGRAVAVAYAREGADVAILYHSHDADAAQTCKAVEDAGRKALAIRGDVSDEAFCKRAARRVVDELGRLDILVSNAAVQVRTDDVQAIRREQLERTFQVNVYGYFFMVQACLPFMPAGSTIIATGSETGIFGSEWLPDYSATQGAIHALTRSLAQQLMSKGIRVNAVAPGPVCNPVDPDHPGLPLDNAADFGNRTGLGRPAQPEEIAPAYVFFASNADSSFITGQVLAELGAVTP
jgi:NAD(P)-dependent dehydrogenase (short-subunit alcohol dehydrogenase family)